MKIFFIFSFIFFNPYAFSSSLIYCSESNPDYFNPQMSISGTTFNASTFLYDRLLKFDLKKGVVQPHLAERWSLSKNKKTYTFYLKKGVSFSHQKDFKPTRFFGADDVLFTFNRQRLASHPYHQVNGGGYKYFKSLNLQNLLVDIKKINQHKIQFVLKKPSPLFLQYLAMEFSVILSKEYGDWLMKKNKKRDIDFKPVGTGPFVLKKYVKSNLIRYERNNKYFLGPASLNKIIFAITPDPTVRFQKLKRKECHIISHPQPTDLPLMKKNKEIKVVQNTTYNLAYLGMNVEHPILRKVKVRQAIAHSLNRPFYIKAIYKGMGQLAHTPLPPNLWGYNKKIKSPSYNIQKAKKLLKEAGYEKGFDIDLWTLPVSRPYNPNGKKMGELMQSDLKKVGIRVKLKTYDWSTYISKAIKGEHALIQSGWIADMGDPSNFLYVLLSCKSVSSGSNLSRWCDKNYDQVVNKAIESFDKKRKIKLYKKAQVIFNQQMPFVPLVNSYSFTAMSPRVKGYVLPLFGSEEFYPISISP
ncbi:MAG: ABC transporter substrate-binding protein [Bdellovibrionales bacterium]